MNLRNIIFDLDGTLLDTSEGIMESARYAASEMGFPELSREVLLTFVGPPIQMSFMKHCGCDKQEAQKAAEIFRDYYKNQALFLAKPYNGIYEVCEVLRREGRKLAVATYKREDYALDLLKHFHFDEYFDVMHGADNNNVLSKKDIVERCIQELNGTKKESVLVGDTEFDAKAAQEMKLPFIGVTYGFGFFTEKDVNRFLNIGTAENPLDIDNIISSSEHSYK